MTRGRATIATLQMDAVRLSAGSTVEANRQACADAIDQAAGLGADVVCLPECCTTMGVPRDDPQTIEPLPGPSFELWSERAKQGGLMVVGWQLEEAAGGHYNTALVIGPEGELIGRYRKVHVTPSAATRGQLAGDEFPVFETPLGPIGVMICYDAYFPEQARILALKGARVLFYPTMSDGRGEAVWELVAKARAVDNAVWVVAAVMRNRHRCYSGVFAPHGRVVGAGSDWSEGLVTASVELAGELVSEGHSGLAEPVEMRKLYWYSRRPEVYGELATIHHTLTLDDITAGED